MPNATYHCSDVSKPTGISLGVLVPFFKALLGHIGYRFGLFLFFTLLFALSALLPPQIFKYFTVMVALPSSPDFLRQLFFWGTLSALVMGVSSFLGILSQQWMRFHVEKYLKSRLIRTLHGLPFTELDGAHPGDWLSKFTTGLKQTEFFFCESLPHQIRNLTLLLGAGFLFLYESGAMGTIPLVAAAVLALLNVKVQKTLAPVLHQLRREQSDTFESLIENLDGMRSIRSHSAERFVQMEFKKKLSRLGEKGLSRVRVLGALVGTHEWTSQFMVTLCLCAAAWGLHQGALTLETVLVYPFYLGLFFAAAQGLSHSAYDWNRFLVEGGPVMRLMQSPHPQAHSTRHSKYLEYPLGEITSIRISKASFGYQAPMAFARHLEMKKHEITVVTGVLGCGKSTFLDLLAGIRPFMEGRLEIRAKDKQTIWSDEGRGVLLPHTLSALVEQSAYLFSASVLENLTLKDACLSQAPHGELWSLLETVGLRSWVQARGGLESFIDERGVHLSAEQKIRLTLVRALLLGRPFLLLDEPFAALDPSATHSLVELLHEQSRQRGIVIVTHNPPPQLQYHQKIEFVKEARGGVFLQATPSFFAPHRSATACTEGGHLDVPRWVSGGSESQ